MVTSANFLYGQMQQQYTMEVHKNKITCNSDKTWNRFTSNFLSKLANSNIRPWKPSSSCPLGVGVPLSWLTRDTRVSRADTKNTRFGASWPWTTFSSSTRNPTLRSRCCCFTYVHDTCPVILQYTPANQGRGHGRLGGTWEGRANPLSGEFSPFPKCHLMINISIWTAKTNLSLVSNFAPLQELQMLQSFQLHQGTLPQTPYIGSRSRARHGWGSSPPSKRNILASPLLLTSGLSTINPTLHSRCCCLTCALHGTWPLPTAVL